MLYTECYFIIGQNESLQLVCYSIITHSNISDRQVLDFNSKLSKHDIWIQRDFTQTVHCQPEYYKCPIIKSLKLQHNNYIYTIYYSIWIVVFVTGKF